MLIASYNAQKYDGMTPQTASIRERVSYKMNNKWRSRPIVWFARSPHQLYTGKPKKVM